MAMTISLIRTLLLYIVIIVAVRLMGKRQISELQTSELVVTLLISDIAAIPMQDTGQPLVSGFIPIAVLVMCEIVVSVLMLKIPKFRRVVCGRPIVVISDGKLIQSEMKRLRMSTEDLGEQLRQRNVFSLDDVAYAIIETNGKLCVVEKESDPAKPAPAYLPLPLIVDGQFSKDNLKIAGTTEPALTAAIRRNRLGVKDVLYADIRQDGTLYVSPKRGGCFTQKLAISGGQNW